MDKKLGSILLGILICFLLAVAIICSSTIKKLELRLLDSRLSIKTNEQVNKDIIILAFDNPIEDEAIVKYLNPNSRATWGKILDFIEKGNPKAVLWNLNLAGYEDSSIASYSPDMDFANVLRKYDNVIIPTMLEKKAESYLNPFKPANESLELSSVPVYDNYILNYSAIPVPDIYIENAIVGVTTIKADKDGILRHAQPIYKIIKDGKAYYIPSIAFATFLKYIDSPLKIKIEDNKIIAKGHVITVDKYGKNFINWLNYDDIVSYPYLSVNSILNSIYWGKDNFIFNEKEYTTDFFKDKIIIVSNQPSNAFRLPAPNRSKFSSAEINANLINNYIVDANLKNEQRTKFPQKAPLYFDIILICLFSYLLIILNLRIKNTKTALSFSALIIAGYVIFAFSLFYWPKIRLWLYIAYPVYIMCSILICTYFYKFFVFNQKKLTYKKIFAQCTSKQTLQNILNNNEINILAPSNKELSIIYYDFSSVSELQQSVPIELISERLSEILKIIEKYTFEYNGIMGKLTNNSIVTYWGAPITNQKDRQNACFCALKIYDEINKLNQKYMHNNQVYLNVLIAVNTQQTSVGLIKANNFYEYSILGNGLEVIKKMILIEKSFDKRFLISEQTCFGIKTNVEFKKAGAVPNSVFNEKTILLEIAEEEKQND